MANTYGYIRVSSKDQNEDRQIIAMNDAGITGKFIFIDKQSGKDFDRPEYQRLRRKLKKGDTLFIKSIDRLGRNYNEILQQWQEITKDIGVDTRIDQHIRTGDLKYKPSILNRFSSASYNQTEFLSIIEQRMIFLTG